MIKDIKLWLEEFNEPVADTAFPPRDKDGNPKEISVPFIIFLDDISSDGADGENNYTVHSLGIERYTSDGNDLPFDNFLKKSGLHFEKSKSWLKDEELFMTVYSLTDDIIIKEGA